MKDSPEIIPAILPGTFDELFADLTLISGFATMAHIDASDGMFARQASWPYNGADRAHFDALQREDKGLPFWEKLDFEAHLMVAEPERLAREWIAMGAMRLVVHTEALKDFGALQSVVGDLTELVLALKLETPLESLEPFVTDIDGVHLMTIPTIGSQGVAFDERALLKVRAARAKFSALPISVDGGVNVENAHVLVEAGASRLIVGSALLESENPKEMYRALREAARGVQ